MTPMKFLPVEEFEKRQKSVNRNQMLAITSSMMDKVGFQVNSFGFRLIVFDSLLKTKIRKSTSSKIRKRQLSWKKKETKHSTGKFMKSPRNITPKDFNLIQTLGMGFTDRLIWVRPRILRPWIPATGHCGLIEQFVEIKWANTKML